MGGGRINMEKITKRQLNNIRRAEKVLGVNLEVDENTSEIEGYWLNRGIGRYRINAKKKTDPVGEKKEYTENTYTEEQIEEFPDY